MHCNGTNTGEMFSSSLKVRESFQGFTTQYLEWNKNTEADDLANVAVCDIWMPTDVFF
jgi:hypothetical protein